MTHGWWEASACHTCFCWQLVQLVLCAACGTGQHCVLSGCCVAERLCVCVRQRIPQATGTSGFGCKTAFSWLEKMLRLVGHLLWHLASVCKTSVLVLCWSCKQTAFCRSLACVVNFNALPCRSCC